MKPEKYARVERERRFLLAGVPTGKTVVREALITDRYILNSRLRLRRAIERIGPVETVVCKLTQKIPWYIRPHADSNGLLLLTATRLSPRPKKTFRKRFTSAGTYPLGIVYPSIISPPSAGCWRLSMRSGAVRGSFLVLVRH